MALQGLNQDDLVFGLDIGTRSIVGVAGYMNRNRFHVVAMAVKEHSTRAMLDGQIHDIYKVGDTIREVKNELETQLGFAVKNVCIAAAGRVLKTINQSAEMEFEEETRINNEHIYSLNLLAVEKAHKIMNDNGGEVNYYCVGYTAVNYRLNSFEINNLEGHKANKIGVELIATFLPEEVVDGLYEAVEYAGLSVASLTLEPIAAMNVAIPEQFRLLNIALVDVGAGTSDICITRDGSIVSYGMIPLAGDEITEAIAKAYLLDFNTADRLKREANAKKNGLVTFKDIMGISQKVHATEIRDAALPVIENMAVTTAKKIKELNGDKAVSAVFVVGGGGKMTGYTDKLADELGLIAERVAVRGPEVLSSIDFDVDNFEKDSLYVTPVGICTNYYSQKNSFVFVNVNDQRVKLYDNNHLTVVDAVMQIGFPNEKLFPRRGQELEFSVNGKTRMVRGEAGDGAIVKVNGKLANLTTPIGQSDIIEVIESTAGAKASMNLSSLEEFADSLSFIVNDKKIMCPRFAYVNGKLESQYYSIKSGDDIKMENYYTVEQLFQFLDMDPALHKITVNSHPASLTTKVYENFNVNTYDAGQDIYAESYADLLDDDSSDQEHENLSDSSVKEEKVGQHSAASKANASSAADMAGKAEKSSTLDEGSKQDDLNQTADNQAQGIDHAQEADQEPVKQIHTIKVLINGQSVTMTGKTDYVLVNLFDFYKFDLSKPQGNRVVIKLNGLEAEYMAPLNDSDVIEIFWEN